MSTKLNDIALMKQVSAGDQQAFALLVHQYSASLLNHCYHILQNETLAKDALQHVLITWWQKAAFWDHKKSALSTWLRRVAHNKCMDLIRSNQRHNVVALSDRMNVIEDNQLSAEVHVLQNEQQLQLSSAILKLPSKQCTAMLLTYYDGKSNAEVADQMGLSVKSVESLLVRARKTVKSNIKGVI